MHVYVEPSGRRIEPFMDPPGEAPIANRLLSDWQTEMIAKAGLTRVAEPTPPCLVVPDTLFTTGAILHGFVDHAGGRNAVLVLKDSLFARSTTPVQPLVTRIDSGFRFEAVRFLSGRDEPAIDVLCDPEEHVIKFALPASFGGDKKEAEISLPRHPVMTLHHWAHILWANQAAGAMAARSVPKSRQIRQGLWAVIRARSINRWKVLGKLNQIGRGCDIHPTAVIEGSTLEDGVSVGAFARVLFSRIGKNSTLMPGAHVEASTLGERCAVSQCTTIRLCVLYPGSVAGQRLMQACVLGRDVLTVEAFWSIDLNLDRDCRVMLDGKLHSTGARFIGSAFGHGSRIGTCGWMAQGRMIPNGAFLVAPPDQVISRIDPNLPAGVPVANDKGTLRPIRPPSGPD
jgi:hypothetical protein